MNVFPVYSLLSLISALKMDITKLQDENNELNTRMCRDSGINSKEIVKWTKVKNGYKEKVENLGNSEMRKSVVHENYFQVLSDMDCDSDSHEKQYECVNSADQGMLLPRFKKPNVKIDATNFPPISIDPDKPSDSYKKKVCKQLFVLAALDRKNLTYLDELRDAVAIMQHHDAITGTGRQHVANDYARILHKAIIGGENIANHALRELMHKNKSDSSHHPGSFQSCLLLNISECAIPEKSKNFSVTVYNPLSYTISHYVRLPVMTGVSYSVRDPAGRHLPVQLVPIPSPLINLPGRKSKATVEMVFKAKDVPPLGYKSYFVERTGHKKNKEVDPWDDGMHFRIGNQNLQIIFNESTGLIQEVKKNGTHIPFQQNFLFYNSSSAEKNSSEDHSSGAYIFRPSEQFATPVTKHKIMGMKTYKGELVEEVHQIFTDWISQVVRVYKDDNNFELEWLVGPLPIDDQIGKEVISRFSTNFESNGTFYTDSNGREMVKRIRNYHPYWDLEIEEPISANYYPVTTKIVIHDNKTNHHLAVFTDRSQGGTSLKDGELELMIHRRTLHDDGFGLDEALNETQYGKGLIARGKHYVVFAAGDQPQVTSLEKEIAQRRGMSPLLFLSKGSCMSFEKWARLHHTEFSGLKASLPKNIKILTLEPWRSNTILLRLEHIFEKSEDDQLSKSVTIDFHDLFVNLPYSEVTEMLLGANQEQKSKKLQWKTEKRLQNETDHQTPESSGYFITLQPMQIRTFIIKLKTGSVFSKMQSFKIS